jgi:hypothetical protein
VPSGAGDTANRKIYDEGHPGIINYGYKAALL